MTPLPQSQPAELPNSLNRGALRMHSTPAGESTAIKKQIRRDQLGRRLRSDEAESSRLSSKDWKNQAILQSLFVRSPYSALRTIRVSLSADDIRLTGVVSTFFLKQMAQETARLAHLDRQIRNQIDVVEAHRRRARPR